MEAAQQAREYIQAAAKAQDQPWAVIEDLLVAAKASSCKVGEFDSKPSPYIQLRLAVEPSSGSPQEIRGTLTLQVLSFPLTVHGMLT